MLPHHRSASDRRHHVSVLWYWVTPPPFSVALDPTVATSRWHLAHLPKVDEIFGRSDHALALQDPQGRIGLKALSLFFNRLESEKKKAASETDAAKVGRKRLKSGVTGETSHEHATNMGHRFPNGKRNLMMNK